MSRGKPLTNRQKKAIYESFIAGKKQREIAEEYGIIPNTVSKVVRAQRELHKKENSMAYRECIVAGNKKSGRLVSTSDPHRYEGTCIVAGKANRRTFTAQNAAAATELWNEWCDELRAKPEPESKPHVQDGNEGTVVRVEEPVIKPVRKTEIEPVRKTEVEPAGEKIDEVYIIWAKGDNPRLYAAYRDMDSALLEIEKINEVASFLLNDCVFDVESVELKS